MTSRYSCFRFGVVVLSLFTVSCGGSLPATGQEDWYQNNGEVATCIDVAGFDGPTDVPPGQDGLIMAGCPMDGRFEMDGAVVRDTCTDLVWQRIPRNQRFTWSAALAFARDLTLDGSDDWRLPNVHELLSLVHYGRTRPALHPVFDFTPDVEIAVRNSDAYWSSTSVNNSNHRTHAWRVAFLNGDHDFVEKSRLLAMRVVRGGSLPSRPRLAACELDAFP